MDLKNKAVTRLKAGGWQKRGPNKLLYAGEVPSGPLPLAYALRRDARSDREPQAAPCDGREGFALLPRAS